MLLLKIVRKLQSCSAAHAILLIKSGEVMVDGIQCTDPVKFLQKGHTIKINNTPHWVSIPEREVNYESE